VKKNQLGPIELSTKALSLERLTDGPLVVGESLPRLARAWFAPFVKERPERLSISGFDGVYPRPNRWMRICRQISTPGSLI
jgi:hypothetical protein